MGDPSSLSTEPFGKRAPPWAIERGLESVLASWRSEGSIARQLALDTTLRPRGLLDVLLRIERGLGRVRDGSRWGPRTVDLDLLVYDGVALDEPGIHVPHPRLHERRFALEPLVELDPDLVVPGRGTVSALLARLD